MPWQPHGLQHTRPPSPSPTPRVYSSSGLSSQGCHPTISSSVVPFSYCLQSFPASGSFPMSQFFTSGGQSIGVSASASVLPMNIQYSQSFCNLGCRIYRYGGSMLCCLMNSDFLLTVCCLSRIIVRVKILGKY